MNPEKKPIPKVTLCSTLPFTLHEAKPGQSPSIYDVNRSPERGKVGIIYIHDAYYAEMIPFADAKAPLRKVPITAETVAEGLINDYIAANLAVRHEPLENGTIRKPGLFYLVGNYSEKEIYNDHFNLVLEATNNTAAWFQALVEIADDDWQKFHQHKMITDLQRTGARFLGMSREWAIDAVKMINSICPNCAISVNPVAVMCSNCKFILNKEKYQEFVKSGQFAATA